jgi:tRNA (cytidine/uridine-2'-O-)-methyltransferase
MLFNIALYEPEIPPNTGNVIRLCANTGCRLHLIHPLGFEPTDAKLQRAGLDYHDWANVAHHENYEAFIKALPVEKIYLFSTKGTRHYAEVAYKPEDVFLFGPETRGLPAEVLAAFPPERIVRLPMMPNNRSLNLSNTVAIVTYEAWRQNGFAGSAS